MSIDRFRFRAWSKKYQMMDYVQDLYGLNSDNGKFMLSIYDRGEKLSHEDGETIWRTDEDEVILLQSTGLRDAEGTLIWESDVALLNKTVSITDIKPAEPYTEIHVWGFDGYSPGQSYATEMKVLYILCDDKGVIANDGIFRHELQREGRNYILELYCGIEGWNVKPSNQQSPGGSHP